MEWDVSLTWVEDQSLSKMTLPVPLAKALRAKGYNRARITVTEDGLLLVPYAGEPHPKHRGAVDLPDWGKP